MSVLVVVHAIQITQSRGRSDEFRPGIQQPQVLCRLRIRVGLHDGILSRKLKGESRKEPDRVGVQDGYALLLGSLNEGV